MILYYVSRIKDKNILNILNESTNKYIDNIKKNIQNKKENNSISDLVTEYSTSEDDKLISYNYGLIAFVSFISFISGYSFGKNRMYY